MQDTASQFDPFFDDSSTSDIVVMAGEAKLHAHKIVLSAQSSLFKAMFQVMLQNATSALVCCRSDCDAFCRLAQRRAQLKR